MYGLVAQLGRALDTKVSEALKFWSYQVVVGSNPIGPVLIL